MGKRRNLSTRLEDRAQQGSAVCILRESGSVAQATREAMRHLVPRDQQVCIQPVAKPHSRCVFFFTWTKYEETLAYL